MLRNVSCPHRLNPTGGRRGQQGQAAGAVRMLPPAGSVWPEEKRKLWLDTADSKFKMIYNDEATSEEIGQQL